MKLSFFCFLFSAFFPLFATANNQELSIISPKNGETIRENAGNIYITINNPNLIPLSEISVLLNKKIFPFSTTENDYTILLKNVDRGTHTLQVISSKEKTSQHTIHLHRFSKLHMRP